MFSDILPHDMGPKTDNSKEINDAMNLHKFYWEKIESLNYRLQDREDDLKQLNYQIGVKDTQIKVLTESYNQALEIIKKCKYK